MPSAQAAWHPPITDHSSHMLGEDFMSAGGRESHTRDLLRLSVNSLILILYKTFTCTDILTKMESVNRNLDFAKLSLHGTISRVTMLEKS